MNGLLTISCRPYASGWCAPLAMIHNIMSGYTSCRQQIQTAGDQLRIYEVFVMHNVVNQGDPAFLPEGSIKDVEKTCTNLTIGELIRQNKIKMNETHFNVSYYGGSGREWFWTSHTSVSQVMEAPFSSTNCQYYILVVKFVRQNLESFLTTNGWLFIPQTLPMHCLKPTKAKLH